MEEGTHRELLARVGPYAALCRSQTDTPNEEPAPAPQKLAFPGRYRAGEACSIYDVNLEETA